MKLPNNLRPTDFVFCADCGRQSIVSSMHPQHDFDDDDLCYSCDERRQIDSAVSRQERAIEEGQARWAETGKTNR